MTKTNATKPVVEDAEEKKPLVDENCVAKSPLADCPGEIRFPRQFTGGLYRTITEALTKHEEDWSGDVFELLPYWRVVTVIAEVDVKGVDAEAQFDSVPGPVLRWARDAAIEYTDRFLTYTR